MSALERTLHLWRRTPDPVRLAEEERKRQQRMGIDQWSNGSNGPSAEEEYEAAVHAQRQRQEQAQLAFALKKYVNVLEASVTDSHEMVGTTVLDAIDELDSILRALLGLRLDENDTTATTPDVVRDLPPGAIDPLARLDQVKRVLAVAVAEQGDQIGKAEVARTAWHAAMAGDR